MPQPPNKITQFWQELKRRKVIRVITIYAAAAFVILELVDIVSPSLRLPEWTMNFIIVLLCVGFTYSLIDQIDSAINYIERRVEIYPNSVYLHYILGYLYGVVRAHSNRARISGDLP
jgi:hypothetical protein